MPELPEVETLKLGLQRYIIGHKILEVEVRDKKVFQANEKDIIDTKIKTVRRFAKVISIELSNGKSLVIHIKLTGQLIYRGPNLKIKTELSKKAGSQLPSKHTRVIFKLDKKGFLYYNDLRKFGWIRVMQTKKVETQGFVSKLGPEPFGKLTFQKFKEILSKSKTYIKVLLMNQEKIGGVGNIYANDALWLARINPKRAANSLPEKEMKELYDSLLEVLKEGIKYGGASELQFVTAEGKEGGYQDHFLAYGQQGKLCPRCKKEKFVKFYMGGRGTYYCSICQT